MQRNADFGMETSGTAEVRTGILTERDRTENNTSPISRTAIAAVDMIRGVSITETVSHRTRDGLGAEQFSGGQSVVSNKRLDWAEVESTLKIYRLLRRRGDAVCCRQSVTGERLLVLLCFLL